MGQFSQMASPYVFNVDTRRIDVLLLIHQQDYQVLNLIGKGGFACVYRARAIHTGQECAIKMVSDRLVSHEH